MTPERCNAAGHEDDKKTTDKRWEDADQDALVHPADDNDNILQDDIDDAMEGGGSIHAKFGRCEPDVYLSLFYLEWAAPLFNYLLQCHVISYRKQYSVAELGKYL